MYNCFDIAKKFIELSKEEGISMPPMKLLKLTYIAHGYYLGFTSNPLFSNEIQAWKFGPVIPDLYHIIRRYAQRSVDLEIVSMYSENDLNKEDSKFINVIWNAYKRFDGLQLSSSTHEEGSPWHKTYNNLHNRVIDNLTIEQYYKNFIDEKRKRETATA